MLTERQRRLVTRVLAASAAALTITLVADSVATRRRRARASRFSPEGPWVVPELGGGLLDIESEAADDPEPEGLIYEDDEPCVAPPHPWQRPVADGPTFDAAEGCVPPADLEPLPKTHVAFAAGADEPGWPLDPQLDPKLRVSYEDVRGIWHGKWGRHFGATRKSTNKQTGETYKRVHVGVDLFADDGDVVYATEPGVVLATLPYYKGLGAVYVLHDSGIVVNYGELKMSSWRDFGIETGIETGQRVKKGQPLGRVGTASDGSHMLHVETFEGDTSVDAIRQGDLRWIAGDPAPEGVLDPTRYLVRARQATLDAEA